MLTSKQRSNLRSIASNIDTIMQVGKQGINENLIKSLSDALEAREIIKISVLENCDESAREVGEILAKELKAEFVAAIGRKVILDRKSSKKNFEHIEF